MRCALLVLVMLTACSNAHQPADPADHQLLDQFLDAECARQLECHRDAGSSLPCDAYRTAYHHQLDSGLLQLDRDAARQCIAALATHAPCVVRSEGTPIEESVPRDAWSVIDGGYRWCAGVLSYTPGSTRRPCGAESCEQYDRCLVEPDCSRHCAHLPQAGQPCNADGECADSFCAWDGSNVCVAWCDARDCVHLGLGHGCDMQASSDACADLPTTGQACTDGCEGRGRCVMGICVAPAPRGGPCDSVRFCDIENECVSGACVARSTPSTCSVGTSCNLGRLCGADGTCTSVADGTRCRVDFSWSMWFDSCPMGFTCDLGQLVCRPTRTAGDACDDTTVCVEGSSCIAGTCTVLAAPSGCPALSCLDGYVCSMGRCIGAPITCDPSSCDGTCVSGACVPRPPPAANGASCTSSRDCVPNARCIGGTCAAVTEVPSGMPCPSATDLAECASGTQCEVTTAFDQICCAIGTM